MQRLERMADDALDLLDLLMATRLLARAERESAMERLRTLPSFSRASAKLAAASRCCWRQPRLARIVDNPGLG